MKLTDKYLRLAVPDAGKKLLSIRLETNLSVQIKRNAKGYVTRSFVFRSVLMNGKALTDYLGSVNDLTIAEARKLAQERRELLRQGVIPKQYIQQRLDEKLKAQKQKQTTVRELIKLFELKKANLAQKTQENIRSILHFLEPFLDVPLSELNETRIPFDLVTQCVQENKLIKARHISSVINQICEIGIDYNLITHNPFTRLKRLIPAHTTTHIKTVNADNIERDLIQLFTAYLTKISHTRLFFLVGFFTLLRPAEVARLKKSNLDTEAHTLFVEKTKTLKQGWTIQTNAILEKLLQYVAHRRPADNQFFKSKSQKSINLFFVSHNLNFTCHGWRSAGMSYLVQQGISIDVANLVLTHTIGSQVTRSYLRSDLPLQRKKALYIWNRFLLCLIKKHCPQIHDKIFKNA